MRQAIILTNDGYITEAYMRHSALMSQSKTLIIRLFIYSKQKVSRTTFE